MAARERPVATYAELAALPEHVVGEILGGELVVTPRPAARHARATSRLGAALVPPFDQGVGGPGGWIILFEPELHLGGEVLVPDLAGWRRERMPELPDVVGFTLAPDWVCEILSPSTARIDRARKLPSYAREGVRHVWLVDPGARTLEVLRLDGPTYRLSGVHADDERAGVEPFAELELALAALWER